MSEPSEQPTSEPVLPAIPAPNARAATRVDDLDDPWPLRPWIMGAIAAVAGVMFSQLVDWRYPPPGDAQFRMAAGAALVVATISFILTVELRRWTWALIFALGWGAIIGGIAWFGIASPERAQFDFPFFSGIFAVLLAAPLFQTVRDEGAWRFPYARLHLHGWTDAVIGAASLFFVGIAFLLAFLIAQMFDLIGLTFLRELLNKSWFGWALAGFAFGAAAGLLRERDKLVGTLQRLVMIILSVLAPVLAVALALFLVSLLGTGLERLWRSNVPTTPLMLLAAAGAVLLANAVIGNGIDDRATNRVMHYAALVLALAVLPLSIIAAISMGARIGEYGWSPERIWGAITVGVALAYGLIGLWAVVKGRANYDDALRPLQTKLAIALCGVALFLALPIVDFGAVSTRSQLARLESGRVTAEKFDWAALKFDFGPAGRAALERIAKTGPADQRKFAARALKLNYRYDNFDPAFGDKLEPSVVLRGFAAGRTIDPAVLSVIKDRGYCDRRDCLIQVDGTGYLVFGPQYGSSTPQGARLYRSESGEWELDYLGNIAVEVAPSKDGDATPAAFDPAKATVEVRKVEMRQAVVNGKPVGQPFE